MAFLNNKGQSISFDCSDLIEELKRDIEDFGEDLLVDVVTEKREGVTIYKDYNFAGDDGPPFDLRSSESVERMTATALLAFYEQENSIF